MTNAEIDEVVKDIQGWMQEAQHGALKVSEIRRLVAQVNRLAKAAKGKSQ